jgi:hypothetical protein
MVEIRGQHMAVLTDRSVGDSWGETMAMYDLGGKVALVTGAGGEQGMGVIGTGDLIASPTSGR